MKLIENFINICMITCNMKMIRVDEHAHRLLLKVKEEMKKEGIEKPSMSDVIRWLYDKSHRK